MAIPDTASLGATMQNPAGITLSGFADVRFSSLRDLFAQGFADGELGASLCVTIDGEIVVDLWGGYADAAETHPWERDTITTVYSATKVLAGVTALLLWDRGDLDYEAPVARYWPEFAAVGKADVTVGQVMAHTAGIPVFHTQITRADIYDWKKCCDILAAQSLDWAPGTQTGYHAFTQGYIIGEVVRRITGRTFGTVFREDICAPIGADCFIGLPASEDYRVAELVPPPPGQRMGDFADQMPPLGRNLVTNPGTDVTDTGTRAWRGAENPAAGGIANGRGLALVAALLANGGVANGVRVLSKKACRRALQADFTGTDCIMGMTRRLAPGFLLYTPGSGDALQLPRDNMIWGAGYGGSLMVSDANSRTSIGYVMNRMGLGALGRGAKLAAELWRLQGALPATEDPAPAGSPAPEGSAWLRGTGE